MSPLPLGILALAGAGGGAGFELIQTTILSSDSQTVDFTNLPTDYKHLQLRIVAKHTGGINSAEGRLQINNNTNTIYSRHVMQAAGSVQSDLFINTTEIRLRGFIGENQGASNFSGCIIDLPDYQSNSKNKVFRGHSYFSYDDASTYDQFIFSGLAKITAPVTSIQIKSLSSSYLFKSQSRFSLYGVR